MTELILKAKDEEFIELLVLKEQLLSAKYSCHLFPNTTVCLMLCVRAS
jgi:hypothetical protein